MKKGWEESRWRRIARFRLGNKMLGSRYWEKDEKIRCRFAVRKRKHGSMCGRDVGTGMGDERCWQKIVGWVFGEEGEWWMREVERMRQEREGKQNE